MRLHPKLFSLFSPTPVKYQLDSRVEAEALGIGSVMESNPQRMTAMGHDQVARLNQIHRDNPCEAEFMGMAIYSEPPLEAAEIQPYGRPQKGRTCLFSMAGELPGIEDGERFPLGDQWPLSCTDQERAFCLLQERVRKLWSEGWPDMEMRLALISDYAGRLRRLGEHNFLHWDGEMLFAHRGLEEEPLAFLELSGSVELQSEQLKLSFTAESDLNFVVVGSTSLLPATAIEIEPGTTCCFRNGQLQESCEPVIFWENS